MNQKSEHVKSGVTVFLTVGAILLFYDTLFGRHWLLNVWRQLLTAVRPILYGAFMAYLLAPVVNFFEARLFSAQVQRAREEGRVPAPAARAAWAPSTCPDRVAMVAAVTVGSRAFQLEMASSRGAKSTN